MADHTRPTPSPRRGTRHDRRTADRRWTPAAVPIDPFDETGGGLTEPPVQQQAVDADEPRRRARREERAYIRVNLPVDPFDETGGGLTEPPVQYQAVDADEPRRRAGPAERPYNPPPRGIDPFDLDPADDPNDVTATAAAGTADPRERKDLAAATDAVLAPGGTLEKALDGYQPRDGQRQLAQLAAQALTEKSVIIAEAGTGTGRTLAYLIPAMLSGRQVIVAVASKELQERIVAMDGPTAAKATNQNTQVQVLKEPGNYLCKLRLEEYRGSGRAEPGDALALWSERPDATEIGTIRSWAETTETGEREEIPGLPDHFPFWRELSASSENCVGVGCPRYDECFAVLARKRAEEAQIVVVNHHVLCQDARMRYIGGEAFLPEDAALVIDESDTLENTAADAFTITVSASILRLLATAARRWGAKQSTATISGSDAAEAAGLVSDACNALCAAGTEFFGKFQASGPENRRKRVTERDVAAWGRPGERLSNALDDLASAVSRAASEDDDEAEALDHRIGQARGDLAEMLRADKPNAVYWIEAEPDRSPTLKAAPVIVSKIVGNEIIRKRPGAVFLSASLSVDGDFEFIRRRLGLTEAASERIPSRFDHAGRTVLYLPPEMPDPTHTAYREHATRETLKLIEATGGRTLVLFTSLTELKKAERAMRGKCRHPLLVQGQMPREMLTRRFETKGDAVLLGTVSFWQAVDIPGPALSCVIVDKLPFPHPADPLTEARTERRPAGGANGFEGYSLPATILILRQGADRLMRREDDGGVIAVLDPRLTTASYAAQLRKALPPSPETRRMEDVRALIERLDRERTEAMQNEQTHGGTTGP